MRYPAVDALFRALPDFTKASKGFKLPRQQFEQSWRALNSSGALKFAQPNNRMFDPANNYVFSVADTRNDSQTNYVIPKSRASPVLVSLARQFEAYAR